MRRTAVAILIALFALVALPPLGWAEGTSDESTSGGSDDTVDQTTAGVEVYRGGFRGKRTGGCRYDRYNSFAYADVVAAGTANAEFTSRGIRYSSYLVTCPNKTPFVRFFPDPPPRNLANLAIARLEASHLPNPEVAMAPSPDKGIVTLGAWFWTTTPFSTTDNRYSVTAAVPELGIWATTTAAPATLTYYPGDGHDPVTCTGPGEPWLPKYGDEAASECMYTYVNSSDVAPNGEFFEAALEITWRVSWTSSTGAGGQLADIRTITRFNHTVRELQAVIISGSDS